MYFTLFKNKNTKFYISPPHIMHPKPEIILSYHLRISKSSQPNPISLFGFWEKYPRNNNNNNQIKITTSTLPIQKKKKTHQESDLSKQTQHKKENPEFSFKFPWFSRRPNRPTSIIIRINESKNKKKDYREIDLGGGFWGCQRKWGSWIWIFAETSSRDIPCMTFLGILSCWCCCCCCCD